MKATKFVKLKRNFPKLRRTVKRNLKVDKLQKIQNVSEQICSEMISKHKKSEQRVNNVTRVGGSG